jgi:hypothetical protein
MRVTVTVSNLGTISGPGTVVIVTGTVVPIKHVNSLKAC